MSAGFELYAAPVELLSIWREFKNSRSAREFRRRLKRKPKPQKRAPREVSTA
jgi:elongation factor P--beta-lysine ligase